MSAKYIPIDEFFPVVEYRLAQSGAPQARFSLFRIGFEDPQLIGSRFGAPDAMRRLNQFGSALASAIHHSDVVSRELSVFWVLSPRGDAGLVRDRSDHLVRTIDEFGLDFVDCHVRGHVFPHPEAGGISNAIALLERFEHLRDIHGIAAVLNRARKRSP